MSEALTNMDSFNEVLVEEPVSVYRDMATSNAIFPLLISLSLLPQLCLTVSLSLKPGFPLLITQAR